MSVEFSDLRLSTVPEGWTIHPAHPPVVNPTLTLVLYVAQKTLPPPPEDPEADPEVRTCPVSNDRLGPEFGSVEGFACGADPGLWACVVSNGERRQWEFQGQRMSEEIRWLVVNGDRKLDLGKGRPFVSPDGRSVACTQTVWDDATGIWRARVVLGADEGPFFQAVEPAGFGADGSFAYRAYDGRRWGVVRGSSGKGPYPDVPELVWSPDRTRLAFVAVTEEGARAVVDGDKGPLYPSVRGLRFSPDGRRTAYIAATPEGERQVVDGVEGPVFPHVGRVEFSDDGRVVVSVAGIEKGWAVAVDGRPGRVYEEIGPPVWNRDGSLVAHVGRRGGRTVAVIGGEESAPADHLYRLIVGPRGGWAHALLHGRTCVLTHNGREVARGPSRPAQLAIGADGSSLAWSESQDDRMRMVVDGRPGEWFDRVERPLYAPDGRTVLYTARTGADAWLVAGATRHGPMEPLTEPVFDADGRRAALAARLGDEFWRKVVPLSQR